MSHSRIHPVHAGNASYEGRVLAKAPLHYWRLIEANGTVAKDLGSSPSNGSYGNTPTLNNTGMISRDSAKGASFTRGSSEYVDVGTLGNLGSGLSNGFTASFWIKMSDANRCAAFGTVNSTGNDTLLRIFLNASNAAELAGSFHILVRDEDAQQLRADTNGDVGINDGARHHILVTANPAADTITMYLDGSAITPNYSQQETPSNFANFDRNMYLAAQNNGTVSFPAQAVFQEMAFWNSILTQADVTELYLIGKNGP